MDDAKDADGDALVLIDAPFMPDPVADREMGNDASEQIADEWLRDCRLTIVRRVIEPITLPQGPGGVVRFACTFQPGSTPNLRFGSAQISLRLNTPADVTISALQPQSIVDEQPVEFTLETTGKLGLKGFTHLPGVETGIDQKTGMKYASYHCRVTGSGESSRMARWILVEDPIRKDGIGNTVELAVTLPVTGEVTASLSVSARLLQTGLAGDLERFRNLILRRHPQERTYPITMIIAAVPQQKSLIDRFFGKA